MARKGKTEKVSVTLPGELLNEAKELVSKGELSSFVSEAVAQYVVHRRQKVALEKGRGAWKDENHPDLMTPEDSTAYIRSIRETDRERLARLRGTGEKQ